MNPHDELETFRCVRADSREPGGYRAVLGEAKATFLHTDPPYCLLTRRRKGGDLRDPRANKKIDRNPIVRFETVRDYRVFTEEWMTHAVAHLTPDAPMAIWTNLLGKEPILAVARSLGFHHLRGEYVWGKRTTEKNANEQLLRVYEVALVLSRTPAPELEPGGLPTVWAVVGGYDDDAEAARWGNHPHHKPFSVLEPLVRTWSRPGDWVLDPFAGSGSMPAAALRLGRRAACLEVEPEWAERVNRRLRETAGERARGAGVQRETAATADDVSATGNRR
ncbi:site-specific DNA-methyltransferase (adenine-specific) [Archangium gephyra]|uniref:Methyltransferase n=1 Tax=Archangium gephyra TaxID=48 RepID=A0AAC8TH82_9BACT|nr:DNA methyltransferase [Archangium gephyra]AKJ05878.1 Adenine-specific methyltransferase [Archangium gephyra]REG27367.1 site-specific DNA-methyltransferase (adenine-specific) [Archangium gephyra]